MRLLTLNVGVYLLGGMGLAASDVKLLPKDIRSSVRDVDFLYVNGVMNVSTAALVQETLCEKMLDIVQDSGIDILCTQEDVLADNDDGQGFRPVFAKIYEAAGYTIASLCESHLSRSDTLKGRYGDGKVKLGNVIYVKHGVKYSALKSIPNLDCDACLQCGAAPRCAAAISVGRKQIYNVHLCGGRFDDQSALSTKDAILIKIKEMNKLAAFADIICGDFNSTLLPRTYDYGYPKSLKADFTKVDELNWRTWQEGVITHLMKKGYNVSYSDLDNTPPTTSRGNITVDWIFSKKSIKVLDSDVVQMYGLPYSLTDHNGVLLEF